MSYGTHPTEVYQAATHFLPAILRYNSRVGTSQAVLRSEPTKMSLRRTRSCRRVLLGYWTAPHSRRLNRRHGDSILHARVELSTKTQSPRTVAIPGAPFERSCA